jgi:hypothetical protein
LDARNWDGSVTNYKTNILVATATASASGAERISFRKVVPVSPVRPNMAGQYFQGMKKMWMSVKIQLLTYLT